MDDAAAWRVGEVIAELYRVVEVLGGGGMGVVYRVRHLGWNVDLAVKSPLPKLFTDDAARQRFIAEAQTWVSLGLHPHLCSCYYVRTLDGVPRVFAEYVEGGDLREWIGERRLYRGSPADVLARVLDVAIQVAWGLVYAHGRGVVHQDVKPSNVLLGMDGLARLTDFGLARARAAVAQAPPADRADSVLVTVSGMTPAYASPEQVAKQPIGRRSDMFSFAVTVLELFAGGVSWLAGPAAGAALTDYLRHGPSSPGLPRMPTELAGLLSRCLRDDPADRPASMAEVATTLSDIYRQVLGVTYPRPVPRLTEVRADELNNRGVSLLDLGQSEDAEAAFDEALTHDPQHAYSIYNAGVRRWRAGTLSGDALLAQLESARVATDDGGAAAYPLALVRLERGDVEMAVELLEEAARHAPGHPEIMAHLRMATKHSTTAQSGAHRITVAGRRYSYHEVTFTASFNPDGTCALTASEYGPVCRWDLYTGQCIMTWDNHLTGGPTWLAPGIKYPKGAAKEPDQVSEDSRVTSAAFSPDGRWVLLGQHNGAIRLWDLTGTRRPITLQRRARSYIHTACVSRGGQYVLTSGDTGVCLWDGHSGKCVATRSDFDLLFKRVQDHTSDENVGQTPGPAKRLWQRLASRVERASPYSTYRPFSVCLSLDGRRALVSDLGHVWLWDIATNNVRPLPGCEPTCFSPDGRWALTNNRDAIVRLWDLDSGRCLRTLDTWYQNVSAMCVSPDGRRALTGGHDATVRLWDLDSGRCIRRFIGHTKVTSVCFSPDGRRALSSTEDRTALLWELPSGEFLCPALLCRPRPPAELADAETRVAMKLGEAERAMEQRRYPQALTALAAARAVPGHERTPSLIKAWRRVAYGCVRVGIKTAWSAWVNHNSGGMSIDFWDNGHRLIVANRFGAMVWDLDDGSNTRFDFDPTKVTDHTQYDAICVSDGYVLIATANEAQLWKLRSRPPARLARTFVVSAREQRIDSVCFGPGGRQALTGSADGTVRLWNLATGDSLRILRGHDRSVVTVCLSPTGRYALTGDEAGVVLLWDLATGDHVRPEVQDETGVVLRWDRVYGSYVRPKTQSEHDRVEHLCFSPNGRDFVIARRHDPPQVWSRTDSLSQRTLARASYRLRHTLVGHAYGRVAACFSPDGQYILTGSWDRTVRLWDLATGRCLHTMDAAGVIDAVRFSPTGAYAAATGRNTTRFWALDWELAAKEPADWDDGAAPYLDAFLAQRGAPAVAPTVSAGPEIRWTEAEFAALWRQLQCAGYGWLRPDGVRAQLQRMASDRHNTASPIT